MTAMLHRVLIASGISLSILGSPANAAQPVTITDAAGNSVSVTNSALNINSTAATHAQTSVLASNLVAKASAGTLYSFNVSADSTLAGAAWWVMIFDATTLPADGTVTPAKCYAATSGQTTLGGTFAAGGVAFTTGIVIGVSTNGCFTKAASTHAFIAADYQ